MDVLTEKKHINNSNYTVATRKVVLFFNEIKLEFCFTINILMIIIDVG